MGSVWGYMPSARKASLKVRREDQAFHDLKNLKQIAKMRAKGDSLRKIAGTLNLLGIKSPLGDKYKWHANTVSRILKRNGYVTQEASARRTKRKDPQT